MYRQFYGLKDIPFRLAPDPKYLFRTESLLEVFANLQYGIDNGKGLVVVIGEVGTGKTTTLRSNLQTLDPSIMAAYIFNPLLSTAEFFDMLFAEFRLPAQPSKSAMLRTLGQVLIARHTKGLRTVLVIDEAHLLPHHLLEEIRLLSNFETNREKLLQIILCGQPELHEVLARPDLRQLKQRVSLRCTIQPLTEHETGEYIRWRLRIAGAKNVSLFEPAAVAMVHRVSGGIPRIINNVCDNALLTGFSDGSPKITASIIKEVVGILDLDSIEVAGLRPAAALVPLPAMVQVEDAIDRYMDEPIAVPWGDNGDQARVAENVRYIRPEYRNGQVRRNSDKVSFVIEFEGQDDAVAPKFFSRVRVTKRS